MTKVLLIAGTLMPTIAFADGSDLFAEFCQSCHGENAEVLESFAGSSGRFREILEGDTEDMPDFYGIFSPEQVAELYQFVTSIDHQQ